MWYSQHDSFSLTASHVIMYTVITDWKFVIHRRLGSFGSQVRRLCTEWFEINFILFKRLNFSQMGQYNEFDDKTMMISWEDVVKVASNLMTNTDKGVILDMKSKTI